MSTQIISAQFGVRDPERRKARRFALVLALLAGAAIVVTIETLLPSRQIFTGSYKLPRTSRQSALATGLLALTAIGAFVIIRRRDAGFWTKSIALERSNEIWRLNIKADVAFRAVARNEEPFRMVAQRAEFVQAEVGAKFDKLCEHIIKESADLSTIDSTARLQLDVAHVFKRYATFHRHLAETRHKLLDEIMRITDESIMDLLQKLPGEDVRADLGRDIRVSVSYPTLNDTVLLQKRRAEWDETLRTIVSIGAATGNEIVGDWIDRASRGEVTAEEIPAVIQLLRSNANPQDRKILEIPSQTGVAGHNGHNGQNGHNGHSIQLELSAENS